MLECLEAKARELGLDNCILESTVTARNFYSALGYIDDDREGCWCQPLAKRL
jgi:hypothetical protein